MTAVHQPCLQLEAGLGRGVDKALLVEPGGQQFGFRGKSGLELREVRALNRLWSISCPMASFYSVV
jgi:hypothetical protein